MPKTTLDLYRSIRKDDFPDGPIVDDHAVAGVLYPTFESTTYVIKRRGQEETRTRRADVTPYTHKGERVIDPGGGTSLFDRSNTFGRAHWWYFKIPEGTVIPDSLKIRYTGRNEVYDADHYQIEAAANRMRVTDYKGALDNLARNAVVKLCQDAH